MKKVCIIGANGFIGKKLCETLLNMNIPVLGVVRSINFSSKFSKMEYVSVGDINQVKDWNKIFVKCDYIFYCAGKAHKIFNKDNKNLNLHSNDNIESISILANQAAKNSVKRLIFISTIKVNGEKTSSLNKKNRFSDDKKIFTHKDIPRPNNSYGKIKLEIEKKLWEISNLTNLEVVVIRPPLVYGKGVKGNLSRLINLIKTGLPLPLGNIQNQRSIIGIENLIDALICCMNHKDAAGKTFLVSDEFDLSTSDLVNYIALSLGYRVKLFFVPIIFLKFIAFFFGKRKEINSLTESLRIDSSYINEILNWKPPLSTLDGIRQMVKKK